MLETLLTQDTYRVEYLAGSLTTQKTGLVFYLSGRLYRGERYCHEIKHALIVGLCLLRCAGRGEDLKAIYLDLHSRHNPNWPAYARLKDDLQRGFIGEVFTLDSHTLLGHPYLRENWVLFLEQHPQVHWWLAHLNEPYLVMKSVFEFSSQSLS